MVVVVTVDSRTGEVLTGPEIVTRGWIYAPEAEDLLEDAKAVVLRSIGDASAHGATDFETIRRHSRTALEAVHCRAHPALPDHRARGDGGMSAA